MRSHTIVTSVGPVHIPTADSTVAGRGAQRYLCSCPTATKRIGPLPWVDVGAEPIQTRGPEPVPGNLLASVGAPPPRGHVAERHRRGDELRPFRAMGPDSVPAAHGPAARGKVGPAHAGSATRPHRWGQVGSEPSRAAS